MGLVDRLAAQNLVTREQAEDDRRQVYVRLTARGERLIGQLSSAHREELRRIMTFHAPTVHDSYLTA